MSVCSVFPAPDICPDKFQLVRQFLALLPRGRAWANNDGGPQPTSVLYKFWLAVADFYAYLNARICALRPEFFCKTAVETTDWWLEEYGLPDGCDPFPDACAKIKSPTTPNCPGWVAACARAGWDIVACTGQMAQGANANCAEAGCARAAGVFAPCTIWLTVSLSGSPAYSGVFAPPPLASRLQAGQKLACPPDLSGLYCVLARFIPAHVTVNIEVIE